ncbi:hypothetical protein SCHPADRAFT_833525 [Schizopora paradoxa]|uniref:Protein kinase domain-containing protein n=1 Tax=Schizopora paradoxa TaxID=27342 RepID=A0A0H2RYB1_9AGAM|nr:hypothetical protein SCHPADRAFT_833525 [Schizopora paradoxa]
MRDILLQGTDVFIKWGSDNDRVKKLLHEASLYANELVELQGTVVPRLVGTFTDRKVNPKFVCLVLEHLSGIMPDDVFEANRQMMVLIGKLHNAGVRHKQMLPLDEYEHFIPSEKGMRIVDFTLAEKHECRGCPPLMPNDPLKFAIGYDCCYELYTLETELARLDLSQPPELTPS